MMHPILIDFGFYALPAYGVLLAIGVGLGMWTLKRRADAAGMDGARLVDLSLWLLIWALVGAKGLLILVELPRYLANPADLLGVIRAGGVFLGGFIAAFVAAAVLLRRYGLQPLPTFDVMAPSIALGHSVGRLGCLLAGCCWGSQCELPWAITYSNPAAAHNVGTPLHIPLHPFPLYAAFCNFLLYLGLAVLYRRRPAPGRVIASYLVFYGGIRFLLEYTRGDEVRGHVLHGLLSTSQLIALVLICIGAALHWWIGRRSRA